MNPIARIRPFAAALTFLAFASLVGCGMRPDQETTLVNSGQKVFTILEIDPPKHVYVDLKDEKGQIYKHVYVSKHCNNWRQIVLGSTVTLTVNQYARGPERWESISAGPVCPRG